MTHEDGRKKRLERQERKTTVIPPKLQELDRKATIAERNLTEFQNAIEAAKNPLSWTLEDWRSFFQSTPKDTFNIVKEIITKIKQKKLQNEATQAKLEANAAKGLWKLTGYLPGEKSGVVEADKIAEKKIQDHNHKVTIYTARLLAYGKDDKLKEEVMKEVSQRYPDLVPKIKKLATKAKQRLENGIIGMASNRKK